MRNPGMTRDTITVTLPPWVAEFLGAGVLICRSVEERMQLVIALSRLNILHDTGGPFGAAVFESESGRLVAAGVNLVVSGRCSVLHAEMVALMLAQQVLRTYDLGAPGIPACELMTSVEPCAMCLGAVPWSGVRRLVCGARGEDAEAIGFDEGTKPEGWGGELERRGIEVIRDCCRDEAVTVLREYGDAGGVIYNSRGVR
jgi:tRNA(Arg) A34 adenosine deaminase TadA